MADQFRSDSSPVERITDAKNMRQFVGFQIESQNYAFPIEKVQEIVMPDHTTETPQVAPCVDGVSNLRGAIIPIINLRKLLQLTPMPTGSETRTIVVNVGDRTMGCTVDSVSQVIRIASDSIQPVPEALTADGNRDIAGFAKLDEELVILLDVDQLFAPERFS